jgi:hypothetical protein
LCHISDAQTVNEINKSKESVIDFTYEIYKTDDLLNNGRIYIPTNRLAQGHPYFDDDQWKIGTIFINDVKYEEKLLKLNLSQDKFIISIEIEPNNYLNIELNSEMIDSVYLKNIFYKNYQLDRSRKEDYKYIMNYYLLNKDAYLGDPIIKQKKFINHNDLFYEEIFQGTYSFLKKYDKDFKKDYSQSNRYGTYTDQKVTNYILYDNKIYEVNNKKEFLEFFSDHEKEIKAFLKNNRIKYNSADNRSIRKLLEYCNSL